MRYFNTILTNASHVAGAETKLWFMCIEEGDKNPFIKPLKYCIPVLLVFVVIYVLTNGAHI